MLDYRSVNTFKTLNCSVYRFSPTKPAGFMCGWPKQCGQTHLFFESWHCWLLHALLVLLSPLDHLSPKISWKWEWWSSLKQNPPCFILLPLVPSTFHRFYCCLRWPSCLSKKLEHLCLKSCEAPRKRHVCRYSTLLKSHSTFKLFNLTCIIYRFDSFNLVFLQFWNTKKKL